MQQISKAFLDHLANLFILTDGEGNIIRMNEPVESLLTDSRGRLPGHISEIAPCLCPPLPEDVRSGCIKIGDITKSVWICPIRMDSAGEGWLYLLETPEILRKIDFDLFLDYIDDAIVIADQDGVMDHINIATRNLTDINGKKGASLKEEVRIGNVEESLTLRVLKTKKTEQANVRYNTGRTLTFTSIPLFGKDGTIGKVISTGRDVTKLIQIQEDLRKTEALKDSYYSRMSTLESLVGSNTIVHSSDGMKRVVSLAIKAAKSDSPVFVWGESGVGKELIADLIHKSGNRKKRPFVGINCSAVPSELIEAEFFGYEEGAFTGAKKGGKRGLFEEAGNGTLFLDEITELPFPMQSKLLRALQEREFLRVGGTRAIPLQAHIISSSNLTKDQLSDPSKFRRDLFYRLNVIPLFIPPLRNRREDIFPLVRFFLKNMNIKYNSNIRISLRLMTRFYNYHWPGNVRELKNIIERLIVTADKEEVDIQDYLAISQLEEKEETGGDNDISISMLMPLKTAQQKMEELMIRKAIKESGTIPKAAEILGIAPSTIYRKVEKGQIRLHGQP